MKRIIALLACLILIVSPFCVFNAFAEDSSSDEAETTAAEEETDSADESSDSEAEEETEARTDDEDPLADADGFEIPTSFYIGGGVIVVFIIASVVVLIMGKPKEK
ncbi:MAG: hypothetical protein LUC25_03285 [Ruminococcus sp.]|nr:hypothetical protein [Ruminococcus sp.]